MINSLRYRKLECIYFIFALLILAGCQSKMKGVPVNLEPNNSKPILSVQVGDVDEATLLVQTLDLEVVRLEGLTVFFLEDTAKLSRMAALGYEVKQQNPYDVFRRVVRIDRSIPEAELVANGIQIINRERQYFVADASIGQLRALVRSGVSIVAVSGHEPRPRQIRVIVKSAEDVAKIGAMEVDIYSAKPEREKYDEEKQPDRKSGIVIYGGAFDYQIDRLRDLGYHVEILVDPAQTQGGQS